ncbi:MAG: hypothetical protein ACJ76Y_10985 [Thermoanaerobaculia bacterium]
MAEKIAFKPDAFENFASKGEELLSKVKGLPNRASRIGFQPERVPVASFTEKDILHVRGETVNPLTMEVSEIFFEGTSGLMGLTGDDCKVLNRLAEAILRVKDFGIRVSYKFSRNVILDWLEKRTRGEIDLKLPGYLEERVESAVDVFEVWVPLANLAIERALEFGPIKLRPLQKEVLDGWLETSLENRDPESAQQIEVNFLKERQRIQGLAAVYLALRGESDFAVEKALEKAEELSAFFRVLHPANSSPNAAFYCRPLGSENVESYCAYVVKEDKYRGRRGSVRLPVPDRWDLDNAKLDHLEALELSAIREMWIKSRTNFQNQIIDALLIYSRSTMARDPTDKLIYIMVALESILVKDGSEAIQQNVGERLAFFLGKTVQERRDIVSLVKTCYSFRSQFVHHGQALKDLEEFARFMVYAWVFFLRLVKINEKYKERREFLDELENLKFSVPEVPR